MTLVFESSAPAAPRNSGRTTRARPDMSGEGLYRWFKVFDQFDPQQQLKTFKRIKYEVPIITGWWFFATPLKNDGVKVSWDDEIPN